MNKRAQLISSSSPSLSLPSSSISSSSMIPFMAPSSMGRFFNSAASVNSLKTISNLLFSMQSGIMCFLAFGQGGGGNIGSTAILSIIRQGVTYLTAFSIMLGISRERYGADSSRQGFVFTSISHGFMSSSIMKS